MTGVWSLPGGHIEPGERAIDAAAREVAEETGIATRIEGLVDINDVIFQKHRATAFHNAGRLRVLRATRRHQVTKERIVVLCALEPLCESIARRLHHQQF